MDILSIRKYFRFWFHKSLDYFLKCNRKMTTNAYFYANFTKRISRRVYRKIEEKMKINGDLKYQTKCKNAK